MSSVAESDTSLWLHNKLGSTDDLWSAQTICSQLRQEILRNAHSCFQDLQSHVKLKFLLSFLHLPRRHIEQWKSELDEIVEMAVGDSDQWVSVLGELLKTFASTGTVNLDIEENSHLFAEVTTELKKLCKRSSDSGMLPLECLVLNKTALTAAVGQLPQTDKHFALKRKPKSAALRAELLQKSSEALTSTKKNAPSTVPIRSRSSLTKKLDTSAPLKGLPSRVPIGGFRSGTQLSTVGRSSIGGVSAAGRKEGGIKLLDITEQPLGGRHAKKRRVQEETKPPPPKEEDTSQTATPDYAVGLIPPASIPQKPLELVSVSASTAVSSATVPEYVPSRTAIITTSQQVSALPSTAQARENLQQVLSNQSQNSFVATIGPSANSIRSLVQQHTSRATTPQPPVTQQVRVIRAQALPQTQLPAEQQPQTQAAEPKPQATPVYQQRPVAPLPATQPQPNVIVQAPIQQQPKQQQPQQQPQQQQQQQQPQSAPQKKGLSLTREQMLEAQEMFRRSNKVTRPEKALILGFMAGSRENPYPQQGDILTIKLSENTETVQAIDGAYKPMIVEMYFQMNYGTGEWKRIQQVRENSEFVP
ncbi:PREDICTED: negative elongation factor A-like [Priapulus caudatus]|uniref:Negative elongation factor A-like n=1 Tax=Priapulus caudatus TaxID=37621 RepID=A0ABM1DZH1_PRICU|nr:PREDICTED: negative elongation factor A-like [Priapulus caudatus]